MLCKKDGIIYRVLNNFDLTVPVDHTGPSLKQHTGTRPFMVIDLLEENPSSHVYHHDIEFMIYVLLWITSQYESGVEISNALQHLEDDAGENLSCAKRSFLTEVPSKPIDTYFTLWMTPMHLTIHAGYMNQSTMH